MAPTKPNSVLGGGKAEPSPSKSIARVQHVALASVIEHARILDHLRVPALCGHVDPILVTNAPPDYSIIGFGVANSICLPREQNHIL